MISSFPKKSLFIEVETTYSSLLGMLWVITGMAKAINYGKIQPVGSSYRSNSPNIQGSWVIQVTLLI